MYDYEDDDQRDVDHFVVTPEIAHKWVRLVSPHTRMLDYGLLEKYTEAMRAGEWSCDSKRIVFDHTGRITDGQHRLWAVVRSGVNTCFRVAWYKRPRV